MDERSGIRGCISSIGGLVGMIFGLYLIFKFFELILSAIF